MPTAADGSVLGDDAKLYYSATLGGAGTLTEVPVVIDDTIGSERRTAESNCRGDAEVSEHVGKPKHTISGTMLFKRGTPGATYLTLRNAYAAGTLLHFALASGTVADTAQHVFRIEGKFKRWEESRPDNDTIKASFEIARSPDSSYASNWAVVAGA
jgi:hypothetical protein